MITSRRILGSLTLSIFLILSCSTALSAADLSQDIERKSCNPCKPCNKNKCCKPAPRDCKRRPIPYLPYVIRESGTWFLPENLEYRNADKPHIAVDVQADSVEIDLCNHILSVKPNAPASAIRIGNHSDVSVKNGTIRGTVPVDNTKATDIRGITLEGATSVQVDNVYFQDLRQGVYLPFGHDNEMLSVTNSNFKDIYSRDLLDDDFESLLWWGAAIGHFRILGLFVDNCQFSWDPNGGPFPFFGNAGITGSGFGTIPNGDIYAGESENGIIQNCSFINHTFAVSWWPEGNTHGTLLVKDSNFLMASSPDTFDGGMVGIQLCCPSFDCTCRSLHVKNCNFQSKSLPAQERSAIEVPSACSAIIEDCTFNIQNTIFNGSFGPSTISVGRSNPGSFVDNVIIRNCTFAGNEAAPSNAPAVLEHISLYKTRGALIENNQFTDACLRAIFVSTTSFDPLPTNATIRNNVFTNNPGNGITVDAGISGTVIQDNLFRRNGMGVELNPTSSFTVITDNTFHLNGTHIATNGSLNNTIQDNLETQTEQQEPCDIQRAGIRAAEYSPEYLATLKEKASKFFGLRR